MPIQEQPYEVFQKLSTKFSRNNSLLRLFFLGLCNISLYYYMNIHVIVIVRYNEIVYTRLRAWTQSSGLQHSMTVKSLALGGNEEDLLLADFSTQSWVGVHPLHHKSRAGALTLFSHVL